MVQGNPILDTFARGAIESIPVAGSILIKFYDKYSETNAIDASSDLTETLKTMNQMNEQMFMDFCNRLQNSNDEILKNRNYLKKLVTDTSKILSKIDNTNKKLDNVDEKLIRIEQRLVDLYHEGEKQLTAEKITDVMFQRIEERDQQIAILKTQLEDLGKNPSFNAD
jgi:predicted RNase H-like nuclease (RuvC/YqgF family)